MSLPKWQPSTLYAPGAAVQPRSTAAIVPELPYNNSFESGLTHWTVTGAYASTSAVSAAVSATTAQAFDGAESAYYAGGVAGTGPPSVSGNPSAWAILSNGLLAPVVPGQKINFSVQIYRNSGDLTQSFCNGGCAIAWYDANSHFISYSYATYPPLPYPTTPVGMVGGGIGQSPSSWVQVGGEGTAPAKAAYAQAVIFLTGCIYGGSAIYADDFQWDYAGSPEQTGLMFVAVQSVPGVSNTTEPVWPTAPVLRW